MAFEDRNAAYDFSLFEEVPAVRKREQVRESEGEKVKKQAKKKPVNKVTVIPDEALYKIGRKKVNPFKVISTAAFGAAVAFLLIVNIYGRVQLTELNQKILNTQEELVRQQSVYTQTQLSASAKYSTVTVEEFAKNNLKMSRDSNNQKEFVSLSSGDKAEIIQAEDSNIFVRIVNAIKEILS